MELKVWVDGVQRVVCGLAERTTCQEVIYALAHATQRTGRFVLVEKFRKTERSLSPHDRPLELLSKWGEYASDVQFVLRCLEDTTTTASSNMQQQQRRPSSALPEQQLQQRWSKMNGNMAENHVSNRYRRMNNSLDENGCVKGLVADLSPTSVVSAQNGARNGGSNNNAGSDWASSNNSGQERIVNYGITTSAVTPPAAAAMVTAATGGVLKPYFVDTSNPTPESGTLLRPTSAIVPVSSTATFVQQPASYEAAPAPVLQNFVLRRAGTLSPVPPVQPAQPLTTSGGIAAQRTTTTTAMMADNARRIVQQQAVGDGSLTVLSQSAHESLTNTSTTTASSFDSSGATLYLESSYASSNNAAQQPAKQLDLSQTSFCSSSMSSNASTGAFSGSVQNQNPSRMNGSRPPPPSYDTFVQTHKRNQLLMANRNGQGSPAPAVFGQGMVHQQNGIVNRSRTPVVPMTELRPAGPPSRDQLIRLIENQQFQIQAQCQTMRSYDAEIAQRESSDRSVSAQTPIMEQLRRELQQLEVERVHVKQKVEELRRQDLDTQLATLRQTLAETLLESAKLDETLKSMDAQMMMNEEKVRSLSDELEKERNDIFNLTTSTSMGSSLSDSLLASNEAFEARIRSLDEMLREKRKRLDFAQVAVEPGSESPMKHVRARSFIGSNEQQQQQQALGVVDLAIQQRPVENASGVWV